MPRAHPAHFQHQFQCTPLQMSFLTREPFAVDDCIEIQHVIFTVIQVKESTNNLPLQEDLLPLKTVTVRNLSFIDGFTAAKIDFH